MKNRTLTLAGLGATAAAALGTGGMPAVASAATAKKYVGAVSTSEWGPVKVTITVKGKKITSLVVNAEPHTARSYQLQSYSLPILRTEGLKAQSYKVHTVSGATYTSESFMSSLHSAMKHAHLG